MEPSPPDAVVFDNDGLLLDTESVWTRAEQDLFERRGAEFTPADKRELVGTSAEIAGGVLERRLGEPGPRGGADRGAERAGRRRARARGGGDDRRPRAAARRCSSGAPRSASSPTRRSSSSSRSLEIVGFDDHFDVVLSAHEVAAPKPAPDPYLEACRRLGVEPGPSVVALEDSPTGVAAARAAGLTVIGVPSLEGVALEEAHHLAESLLDDVVARRSPLSRLQTQPRLRVRGLAARGRGGGAGPARRSRAARRTLLRLLGVRSPPQRRVGGLAGLAAAAAQRRHVLLVAGIGERALQLDQQRLEADPQLQRRLASRPASRSARARSSSVSQASICSRPPSTAATRSCGRSSSSRRRRREAPLARTSTSRAAREARRRRPPRRCRSRSAPRPPAPGSALRRGGRRWRRPGRAGRG